jgi:hypothetical protein
LRRRTFLRRKHLGQSFARWCGRDPARRPVFSSGVHRSGTNMMMEILEWSPATEVFREGDRCAFEQFMMRSEPEIAGLIDRSSADQVVGKALHEAEHLADFLTRWPTARVIWMFRDWRDVVNSSLARWPGRRNGVDRIVAGRDTAGWRGRGMTAATRRQLAQLYRPDLDDASANALFWIFRNQLLFDQGLKHDERVLLIDYDDWLRDPTSRMDTLATFLGMSATARQLEIADGGKVRRKPPPAVAPEIAALAIGGSPSCG